MVQCCVPGCAARGSRIFHAFPSNKKRRQIWIEVTRTSHIDEADFKRYAKICRYHFHESDFMINNRGQQGLKPDAVPSLRLPRTINVMEEHSYSSVCSRNSSIPNSFCSNSIVIYIRWIHKEKNNGRKNSHQHHPVFV